MILTVTLNTSIDKLYKVEKFPLHEVTRVIETINTAGGKGLNVSKVAALMKEPVLASGFTGGYNGMLLESLLTGTGIEKRFTHTDSETRCCINICDAETGLSTELLEPGNPVKAEQIEEFLNGYRANLEEVDVVTISGSMPKGLPVDFYATLIREAKNKNKKILLDTSGAFLMKGIEANPSFIKPNKDEIRQITGTEVTNDEEIIEAAKKLHASGIETVAVSNGSKGVIVVSDEGIFKGVPPKITAVNPVGCGDSMVAAFAVSMARGMNTAEQIRTAVAVSAANAMTDQTGSFEQSDFEEIYGKVVVERL